MIRFVAADVCLSEPRRRQVRRRRLRL